MGQSDQAAEAATAGEPGLRRRRSPRSSRRGTRSAGRGRRLDLGPDTRARARRASIGRHHQVALAVAPDAGGRPTAGSEHPFESRARRGRSRGGSRSTTLTMPRRMRDVAHQLGRPGVDLVVALVGETGSIFPRIARQPGRCHGPSCAWSTRPEVCQSRYVRRRSRAPSRLGARSRRRRAASREPSGQSLNCSVSQRPTRPGRRHGRGIARPASCRLAQALGRQRVDRCPRRPAARPRSAPPPGPGPGHRSAASSSR